MTDPIAPNTITTITAVPDPAVRPGYNTGAFNWMTSMTAAVSDLATAISRTYTNAVSAFESATAAAASATAAENASNASMWASGSYTTGSVVWSPINGKSYRRKSPGGASPTDPAYDTAQASWYPLVPSVPIPEAITSYFSSTLTLPVTASSAAINCVTALDADRYLVVIGTSTATHAAVFTLSTQTFGAVTLVRSAATYYAKAVSVGTDKILCVTSASGSAQAVVLSVSGTAVSVGTAASFTGYFSGDPSSYYGVSRFVTCGSTYILNIYDASGYTGFVAMTVSGTTVTVGTPTHLSGYFYISAAYPLSSTTFLSISTSNTYVHAVVVSVSGTTLTVGTPATLAANSYTCTTSGLLTSGRFAIFYRNTQMYGTLATVSGVSVSLSSAVNLLTYNTADTNHTMHIVGSQAIVSNGDVFNVLTDNAGTAVAGTASSSGNALVVGVGSDYVIGMPAIGSQYGSYRKVGVSGNNPSTLLNYNATSGMDSNTTTQFAPLSRVYASTPDTTTLTDSTGTIYGRYTSGSAHLPFCPKLVAGGLVTRTHSPPSKPGASSTYSTGNMLWHTVSNGTTVVQVFIEGVV